MIKIAKNKDELTLIICSHDTDEGQTFGYEFQQDNDKTVLIYNTPTRNYETALLALEAALDFARRDRWCISFYSSSACQILNHSVINNNGCVIDGEISVNEQRYALGKYHFNEF